jgi:pyridoxine 5'-phosphate synthase PdxJ
VVANEKALTETRKRMNDARIEVSLFIAPDPKQLEASARTGARFVERHTGSFAENFSEWWSESSRNRSASHETPKHVSAAESYPRELPRTATAGRGERKAWAELPEPRE